MARATSVAREGLWAVLPVKDLATAKQRLAPVLAADQRRDLFRAMLEDVLATLAAVRGVAGVLVVTRDPEARGLAARWGLETLSEATNAGQTAAVTAAARALAAGGAAGMVAIPADVPLIAPHDIESVLAAHGPAPAVTIAPAHDELGSNAVACSPPELLPLRFGDNSFFPHLERARAAGVTPVIVRRPALGLDVDHPRDLAVFAATPSPTRAYAYLRDHGLLSRLHAHAPQPNRDLSRGSTCSA